MLSNISKIEKLSSRVIRILGCNSSPMTLQGTNTYLVGTGKSRILIDTGSPSVPEYTKNLKSCLQSFGENFPIKLQALVLTHWHEDHVGGIKDVLNEVVEEKCLPLLKFPLSENEKPPGNLSSTYTFLSDGEIIKTEGATLKVVFTPGHTEDHISLHLLEENAIFCADCVLGEGTAVFEDLYDYMNSLNILLEYKPSLMYPGHGKVISDPVQHISNYISHRMNREMQILSFLENCKCPVTSVDIVVGVYKGLSENLIKAAEKNVLNHLSKLVKDGKVKVFDNKWEFKPKL